MKSVNCSNPGYTSIACSKIEHIPYNYIFTTKFNDSSILIPIIAQDYLNFSLANEYVNTNPGYQVLPILSQADQPVRLQYSHKIK